ncbi:MAG: glycosyltransferase family 2 protein [Limisphaerales bacterium]|jgi:glycosyltransferase domain-containing protein
MGDKHKLVSIGIPTYNRREGLLKSINSVLAQSYPNFELIIGDNCSPDYDTAFINKIKNLDPRIKFIRNEKNLGPVGNFSLLKTVASGDYFMWLADDDWIGPDYIDKCVEFLDKNPDYVLVNGSTIYYKNSAFYCYVKPLRLEHNSPKNRIINYYRTVADNAVYYGLIRREALKPINLKNVMGSDWIFVGNLAYIGKIGGIDDIHLHRDYTWNSESIKKIAEYSGLNSFDTKFPYVSIALSAKNEVLNESIFTGLSDYERRLLAWKVFLTIRKRCRINLFTLLRAFIARAVMKK